MNGLIIPRSIATGVIASLLALGCAGGSGGGDPTAPSPPREGERVVISLGAPRVTGAFVQLPVEYTGASDLYALSFRVGFNADGLCAESVEWGAVVGEEDATFHVTDRHGFIPLAFARLDGNRGLDGDGQLCLLRFEILDPARADAWIVADPEYLVAYDCVKQPLTLVVGGDAR